MTKYKIFIYALVIFLFIQIAILISTLSSSLWIDEALSLWLSTLNVDEIFQKSFTVPINPWFIVYLKTVTGVFGNSEFVIRIFSLTAVSIAAYFIYRIAERIGFARLSIVPVILFLGTESVVRASVYARPYSLALMCAVISLYFYVDWLITKQKRSLCLHFVFFVCMASMHYLFASIGLVYAVHVLIECRNSKDKFLYFGAAVFAGLVFVLSNPNIFYIFSSPDSLNTAPAPKFETLLPLTPLYPLVFFFITFILTGSFRKAESKNQICFSSLFILFAVAPIVTAFMLGILTPVSVFIPRYMIVSVIGISILFSRFLVGYSFSNITLPALVLGNLLMIFIQMPLHIEGWREAAAYLQTQESAEVYLYSGFAESRRPVNSNGSFEEGFLKSPTWYYNLKVEGFAPYPGSKNELEQFLQDKQALRKFYIIARNESIQSDTSCETYKKAFLQANYRLKLLTYYGAVCVLEVLNLHE